MNEGLYQHLSTDASIPLLEKTKYHICSFSGRKALDCELMWGHYADAGKGVVIEVELEEDYVSKIVPVDYKYNKDVYENLEGNDSQKLEAILSNKSPAWCYEDEYRYLSTDALHNNKVKIGKITKIYFGTPYEHLTNYNDIKTKSKSLKKYLSLKEKLKDYCESKDIKCEDFPFKLLKNYSRKYCW